MDFQQIFRSSNRSVVDVRRDLHRYPETAFLEYRTAAKVARYLSAIGFDVKVGPEVMDAGSMIQPPAPDAVAEAQRAGIEAGADPVWVARMPGGQTGVVAELRRGSGPVLAFRFDMDALPVTETPATSHAPNREAFRSLHDGRMHACGHDGHVAIGMAVATELQGSADWNGTLKLVFQPAEEIGGGAEPMVRAGVLDDVDYLFVGHLGCLLPTGKIAAEATDFFYATRMDVIFTGRSAHAAMGPQKGSNALLAGASAALALHAIARHGEASTFVNVGQMNAGTARNLVADRCTLVMEVRGATVEAHDYMLRRANEILSGSAAMHGVEVERFQMGRMIGNANSTEASAIVADAAARIDGIAEVLPGWPIGGGDDATFMIRHVQDRGKVAGYFLIGSDIPAIHHASDFDIDEASLEHGAQVFVGIAKQILGAGKR